MNFIKKISDFFNNVSLELDTETENEFTDYILDSDRGLNKINISEHDKSSIINWKLNEFKKYLKFGDGFEKKQINLDLFKDWEKKNQRNFDTGVMNLIMTFFGITNTVIIGKNLKINLKKT